MIMFPFFIALVPLLGFLIGMYTKEEYANGQRYFLLLELALLISIIVSLFLQEPNFLFIIVGLILGLIFKKEYLYFGLALPVSSLLSASLILLYGFPYGTQHTLQKNIYSFLTCAFAVLFILFVSLDLSSGLAAALLPLTFQKLTTSIKNFSSSLS